jgi:hypothetical protein
MRLLHIRWHHHTHVALLTISELFLQVWPGVAAAAIQQQSYLHGYAASVG